MKITRGVSRTWGSPGFHDVLCCSARNRKMEAPGVRRCVPVHNPEPDRPSDWHQAAGIVSPGRGRLWLSQQSLRGVVCATVGLRLLEAENRCFTLLPVNDAARPTRYTPRPCPRGCRKACRRTRGWEWTGYAMYLQCYLYYARSMPAWKRTPRATRCSMPMEPPFIGTPSHHSPSRATNPHQSTTLPVAEVSAC